MRAGFPYLPLVTRPGDLFAYAILRCTGSPRLMRIKPVRRAITRLFPTVGVSPPQLRGSKIFVSTEDSSQLSVFHEVFLEQTYDLKLVPFLPEQVIDCGANVGMFAALAYASFPYAAYTLFEPNAANASLAEKTIKANSLNVSLQRVAVSDHSGTVRFLPASSSGGSVLNAPQCVPGEVEVSCIDLAEYIRQLRTETLLLKMDIEGHEEIVMPAIIDILPLRTAIFFETHGGDPGWQRIAACLRGAEFTVEETRRRGEYANGFALRT